MKPFRKYKLSELITERKRMIIDYIKSLTDEILLSGQDDVIEKNMFEKYHFFLVEIKEEIKENRKISKTKIKRINEFYSQRSSNYGEPQYYLIDGIEITLSFAFTGDSILFECQSNTYSVSGYPDIEISSNILKLSCCETLEKMDKIENKSLIFDQINKKLSYIKEFIGYCNNEANSFNNNIVSLVRLELQKRKEKVDKFNNIAEMLEIPIENKNPTVIETIKLERKIFPLMNNNKSKPEYSISDDVYHGILSLISHQGSSFERTPQTYSKLVEEELRDIMLSSLNAVYQGKVTGETFRKNGKTDISIEYENRSAFVAECKIWSGIKGFKDALNQIQGYITWRDTKLCLIIFSRNSNFFGVLALLKEHLKSINNYLSHNEIAKNEFEVIVKSKTNEGQFLKIRVFVFDLSVE